MALPSRPLSCVIAVAAAIAIPSPASAQAPGVHQPSHHAEPPMPSMLPSPLPSLPPPVVLAPSERPTRVPVLGSASVQRPGYVAHFHSDGSIEFGGRAKLGRIVDPVRGFGPSFTADVTDFTQRLFGGDPYVSDKLALLDSTRPERARLRADDDFDRMERALADLPRYLDAVWAADLWPAETRRRILFSLWDECAEEGNELVRDGGRRGRLIITQFIVRRLPAGAAEAFSPAELEALNGVRLSARAFAPYGDTAPPEPVMVADRVALVDLLAAF